MHRFATRWHRLLACLGLFALGLAIAGPLLSQTQRLTVAGHDAHGAARSEAQHVRDAQVEPTALHEALSACDYCTLFLHMPGALVRGMSAPGQLCCSPSPRVVASLRLDDDERHPHYRERAPPLRSA